MAWTKSQKMTAASACREAGIDDEHRRLILRQFPNARFDAKGNESEAPTSTSKRLTNSDFEQFMAIVERAAHGKLSRFSRDYWTNAATDNLQRMRHLVNRIAAALIAAGLLPGDGIGLANWIEKYVTHGEPRPIERLDFHELHALINGLRGFARGHNVTWEAPAEQASVAAI